MSKTAIVWFRTDLRVHDNPPLAAAVEDTDEVVPVYTFDPQQFGESEYGVPKTGPRRAQFRRESVTDLRSSLRERDGDLVVRQGRPDRVLPTLAREHDADAVHCQTRPATEEYETEASVRQSLSHEGIELKTHWTHTLYHREDLPTPVADIADTFTPWRQDVEENAAVREPVPAPETVPTPAVDSGDVPSLSDLGFENPETDIDDRGVYEFRGGETAGLERLAEYVWERDRLREYKETRNGLLGADYSSKLSPWLAHGCLSPRRVHAAVREYEAERVANESTYWLVFELLWRDFDAFQFEKHGAQFFQPGGIRARDIDWRKDRTAFERWASGETGVPFVDANMRELNATGYMSNRGRQNAASFLANTLGVDWRLGAAYFESRLIDYDVCSNWGNWAYVAGTGNDSRDSAFDVVGQAHRYDGDAEYVTHWCPELDGLPSAYAHEPWTMSEAEQRQYGVELGIEYPDPMVDVDAGHEQFE
ncbi:DASH family cryptochrome [Halorientalis litorea]|uniref:DASH family cryptochrome n=1 Tax=Halorientalis litorea TaxID=2931977 RepID=UPI001FF59F4F|nr:DASH family cryptochrome [Halorientalis litorea]